jgi:hypothetical protein
MKTYGKIPKCVVTWLLDLWYPPDKMCGLQNWSGHYGKEKKSLAPARNQAMFLKKYNT